MKRAEDDFRLRFKTERRKRRIIPVQGFKACILLVGEHVFEEGRILKQEGGSRRNP